METQPARVHRHCRAGEAVKSGARGLQPLISLPKRPQGQGLGTPSASPTSRTGVQVLGTSSAAFPGASAGDQVRRSRAGMWAVSLTTVPQCQPTPTHTHPPVPRAQGCGTAVRARRTALDPSRKSAAPCPLGLQAQPRVGPHCSPAPLGLPAPTSQPSRLPSPDGLAWQTPPSSGPLLPLPAWQQDSWQSQGVPGPSLPTVQSGPGSAQHGRPQKVTT